MSGVCVGAQLDKATQTLDDARVGGKKRSKLKRTQARELWGAHKPASSRSRTPSFAILVLMCLFVISALSGDGLRKASAEAILSSASFLPSTNLIASPSDFSSISQRAEESGSWSPNLPIAVDPESFPPLLNEVSQEKEQESGGIPSLEEFRRSVMNGNANQLTGIWVEDILAFKVSPGTHSYAPSTRNTASVYSWADDHGVTALLIHNYLGGTLLYQLNAGMYIAVVYGNGGVDWYLSRGGTWYEARNYSPSGFKGPFRIWSCGDCDFDISVQDIRWRHYAGTPHLAFQTCVETADRVGLVIIDAYFIGTPPSPQEADENFETLKRIQFELLLEPQDRDQVW